MTLTPAPFRDDLAQGPAGGRAFWATASDGVRIRLGHFPAAEGRGTVLLFPGRTEYIEKYGRTAADLAKGGYHTLVIDWRGQGMADRLLDDTRTGHVDVFEDYQKDVAAMLDAARALDLPRPYHLIAHSMGGCIGLRAVTEDLPVASCVFSGPMWGIRIAPAMRPAAWALSWGIDRLGHGHRIAPGTKSESYVTWQPFEDNQLTTDADMFDYLRGHLAAEPRFHLGGPSLRWLYQALAECRLLARRPSPDLPCLTFCGTNERIVDTARIRQRMDNWPGSTLHWVEGGEHEVLMESPETRNRITAQTLALFDAASAGKPARSA
ncbi:alpha/beta fold hydrolase [Thalassococcus sp. BH17M4-6]|uniref:alpha/beta fold hydrolase n=1 Tax=Thalassococcus sp. BH17M4-6 TaxID=3413148 RepID=UPI003BC7E363